MTSTSCCSLQEDSDVSCHDFKALQRTVAKGAHLKGCVTRESASSGEEDSLRADVMETMANVIRYSRELRKQRQQIAECVVEYGSALDDAEATLDNAIDSLKEMTSNLSSDLNSQSLQLEANWKEALRGIESGSEGLSARMEKRKEEVEKLAEDYLAIMKTIREMRHNFSDIDDLAKRCSSFEVRLSALKRLVDPNSGKTSGSLDETGTHGQGDADVTMALTEMSVMIRRLQDAQSILDLVKFDEHPKPGTIKSLIDQAFNISSFLLPAGDLDISAYLTCRSDSD